MALEFGSSSGGMSLSIDGESIPFTMQAEVSYMSIEAAYAAGLFEEMPDEPGMIRIPVVIQMMIPNHILFPDQYPEIPVEATAPDDVPDPPGYEGGRRGLDSLFEHPSHEVAFRNLVGVFHPGSRVASSKSASNIAAAEDSLPASGVTWSDEAQVATGLRTPDGTPILRVQYDEVKGPEFRPGERELSSPEAANEVRFDNAVIQLRMLEPGNPQLTMLKAPGSVPDDAAVARMEDELDAATACANARSAPLSERDLPLRPTPDESGNGGIDYLRTSPQPDPLLAQLADRLIQESNEGNRATWSDPSPGKAAEPAPLPLPHLDEYSVTSQPIDLGTCWMGKSTLHARPSGSTSDPEATTHPQPG